MRAVVRPLSLPADRRVLVISDIHGNLPFLKGLLKKVQFSTDDILLVLGDILEKSTGGLDTLRYLMDLRRTHTLFFLQGNCENVTLDFLNGAWPDQAAAQYGNFWGEKCAWVSMAHQAGVDVSDPKAFPAARQAIEALFPEELAFLRAMPTILLHEHYLFVHSGEARFHDSFQLFFQDVKMGAVILNQDMTVMQTNKAAQEISQIFWEQYRHNQGHFLRSNYQGDPKFREVQTMINEISERLTTQGGTSQTFTSPAGDITFYHTSFLSSSAAGLIQTWHLMLITCQTKDLPKNLNHPYNTLTQQERRIVYYLASGMKNEQIAEELHISIYTVRTHIANIYKKFEVNNKVDLLMHLQPILKDQTTPP